MIVAISQDGAVHVKDLGRARRYGLLKEQVIVSHRLGDGDQVGVAIENAQLFAEAQRRVDELVSLNQMGQMLSSTLELEQILTILMDQTAIMLDAESGSVLLLDEESGELVFMVAAGPRADKVKGLRLPPGQGVAGWSAQEGQPALVPDVRKNARS